MSETGENFDVKVNLIQLKLENIQQAKNGKKIEAAWNLDKVYQPCFFELEKYYGSAIAKAAYMVITEIY